MNNIEEKLNRIKTRAISEDEMVSLWHSISVKYVEESRNSKKLLFNIFNFKMKKFIVGFVALAVILGGGGVVSASNNALPGDFLFPLDLAVEKIQVKLSSDEKKAELKFKFAEERVAEIKEVSNEKITPSSSLVTNLSDAVGLQVEADVFTNETVVKIEANNKNYGYLSTLKTKDELVKEISVKYSIAEEKITAVIDFAVEDRASRADDKKFLNKTNSINFSGKESEDVSLALTEIESFLNEGGDNGNKEELRKSLMQILVLLGDEGKLEISRDGSEIKIETKDDKVKIEIDNDDDKSSDKSDDSNKSDDNSKRDDDSISNDVKEDDSEEFCRGEWRDAEDCNDDSEDSDDDDDDDSNDDDDSDDDDKDDNSGSGKDKGSDDN